MASKQNRKRGRNTTTTSSNQEAGNITNPLGLTERKHIDRYNQLLKREIKPTRVVCKPTLLELGLLDDVVWLFERLGMTVLLDIDDYTYRNLTLEFLSTVEVNISERLDQELSTVEVNISERLDQEWGMMTFKMLGVEHRISIDKLNEAFSFPTGLHEGAQYTVEQYNSDDFWRRISTSSSFDPSGSNTKHIRHPTLRVAHKLLAYTIFGREETHTVRKWELYFLWGMIEGCKIDIGSHLAKQFVHVGKMKGPIIVGSLITHLAMSLRFNPSRHINDRLHPPAPVGTSILSHMGMIRNYNNKWHWVCRNGYLFPITEQPYPTVRDVENLAFDPNQIGDQSPHRSSTPPTVSETCIPSSSLPSSSTFDYIALNNMLSSILSGQENLQRQLHDILQEQAAIRTTISQMGDTMRRWHEMA